MMTVCPLARPALLAAPIARWNNLASEKCATNSLPSRDFRAMMFTVSLFDRLARMAFSVTRILLVPATLPPPLRRLSTSFAASRRSVIGADSFAFTRATSTTDAKACVSVLCELGEWFFDVATVANLRWWDTTMSHSALPEAMDG
jgi:hypothetical protein